MDVDMPGADRQLGVVLTKVRRVITDDRAAEDTALEIVWRAVTGSYPAWLQAADEQIRLDVLTVIGVLETRRERPRPT